MIGILQTAYPACLKLPVGSMQPAGGGSRRELPASLRVEHTPELVRLTPEGDWCAEMLVDGLGRAMAEVMAEGDARPCLELDLALLAWLDDIGVSAVIVALRSHCAGLDRITLAGLPGWAQARLHRAGAGQLLGSRWTSQELEDSVVFTRR